MSIAHSFDAISIRPAREDDKEPLRLLAQRDSARVPPGRLLVAEVGGTIQAAVAVESGETIADPFRRTAELVALLQMRARQGRRRPPLRIVARSPRRAAQRRHATA
jgi:hypothetical protein